MLSRQDALVSIAAVALASLATAWSLTAPPPAAANSTLQHFEGGSQDELRTTLDSTPRVVYSKRISNLAAGELNKVLAEVQFTNLEDNYGGFTGACVYTITVETQLVLADAPTASSGTAISTPSQTSITADMHHARALEAGSYLAPLANAGPKYVNLVASSEVSDSLCGSPSPHTRVDKGLGRLSVVRYRPTSLAGASSNYDVEAVDDHDAQLTSLQVPTGGQTSGVAYSVPLGGLQSGEVLQILGNAQLSRLQNLPLEVSSKLVLAQDPSATTGTVLAPSNTLRLAPSRYGVAGMSLASLVKDGAYRVPEALAGQNRNLNLVLTATDALATGSNTLGISQGWGQLEVIRHRPDPATGTPPAAPSAPSAPAAQVVQAEDMSVPAGSEVITDSEATPSSNPRSVRMTGSGALSRTVNTVGEKTLLTLFASADICATTPGYPTGSASEGAPIAQVSVDGTVVAQNQSQFAHTASGFRALPIPVRLPAGSHLIQVAFTNPATKAGSCVRRLYVDRLELSAPPSPPARVDGVELLAGASGAESTSALPIAHDPDGSVQWRVVYSEALPKLKRGEVLEAMGEVEVLNTTSLPVVAAGRFILADRPDQTVSESGSPVISLSGTSSDNIPAQMRRAAPTRVASYTVPSFQNQTKYLNLVMFAATDAVPGASDAVTVVADSGRLNLIRHAPLDVDLADVQAPQTALDSGPSGLINDATPSFGFGSDELGSRYECRVDAAAFAACSGPGQTHTSATLSQGFHTFAVRAIDAAGNVDGTPATRSFTVDTIAPQTTIGSGPSGPTNDTTPTFGFSSSELGGSFECRFDSGPFRECSDATSHTPAALPDGPHTFHVRATDAAGNVDATPASRSFTVDTTAPETSVDSGPSALTSDATPTFGFSSSELGGSFECRFDSAPFRDCSGGSSHTAAALPDGPHTFHVRATDAAGNVDATPASRSFTVDTVPPQTTIGSGPSGTTNDATPSFGFSADEAGSSFQCRIDSAVFSACSGATGHTPAALTDGPHTLEVRAIDPAGNVDATPASRSFTVDTTPPQTTIGSGPSGPTNDTTPSFGFSADEAGASFQCRIDNSAFGACSGATSHTPAALSDGSHTFEVRATDPVGNVDATPASRSFTVDTTPPQTTIGSGPSGPTNDATPSFGFSSSELGGSFQCRIDAAPFASCSGPGQTHTSTGLPDGAHTFEVRAIDAAGNVDGTAATRPFTVDTTAPQTTIGSGPSGPTNDATPSFGFSSSELGGSFQCRIDSAAFGACSGPGQTHTSTALPDGAHTFEVRAIDAAGNVDGTAATRPFRVDTAPPQTTIGSGPSGPTNDATPSFGFSADEAGASFQCRIDSAAFGACSGPGQTHSSAALSEGSHSFAVRAIDAAGNVDATAATRSFTVDTTPPQTSADSGPSGLINDATPSFGFSADEAGASFQCRIDSAPFAACSDGSGHTPATLPDGSHTFEVRAIDPAGNVDGTPASRSFTVDTTAPQTAVASGPSGPTNDTTPSFGFSADEAGASFQCRIDSAAFGACSGATTYTAASLPEGAHTFQVRASDPVGNVEITPASRSFTIDTTAPETSVDSGPPALTNDATPSFGFSSNEAGGRFECRIDSAPFAACSGPGRAHTASRLSDGVHSFQVRATDQAANVDATAAQRSFVIDTKPPGTAIRSGPRRRTFRTRALFRFALIDLFDVSRLFECSLDGRSFTPCTSPKTYRKLKRRRHIFQVRAVDAAGNRDPTPARQSWRVRRRP